MEAPCFCRQLWSSTLQRGSMGAPCLESTLTSWVVFLCRALIASFLSRSTLTSIVPTKGQFLSCSFSSQVEQVIHTIPRIKHCKNCANLRHKFPGKPSLNVRSVHPVCPGFPVCPDDHDDHDEHDCNDKHNHDNYDDQFCTFTFWQQRQQIELRQIFWSLIEIFLLMIDIFLLENDLIKFNRKKSIKQQKTY